MTVGRRTETWKNPNQPVRGSHTLIDCARLFGLSPAKAVSFFLLLIGLISLGWKIVADTAAYNAAPSDPEVALALSSTEILALDELAYREVKKSDGDLNTARALAERALRLSPLDARALAVLG